jgi:hypothetical protein
MICSRSEQEGLLGTSQAWGEPAVFESQPPQNSYRFDDMGVGLDPFALAY